MADITRVNVFARIRLVHDGRNFHEHEFSESDIDYTVHDAGRVVLAANMASPQEINLGDIGAATPGTHLMLKTDREIQVALGSVSNLWTVSGVLLFVGSFTHLYVQNTSPTTEAVVEYEATDGA
jgi:hypothetical protein